MLLSHDTIFYGGLDDLSKLARLVLSYEHHAGVNKILNDAVDVASVVTDFGKSCRLRFDKGRPRHLQNIKGER